MTLSKKLLISGVVLSVLFSALMFILMSSLSNARDMAKESQCSDSMTKLGAAIDSYRQDHGGAYPPDFNDLEKYSDGFLKSFLDHGKPWIRPIYRIPDSNEPRIPICWTGRKSRQNPSGTFSSCVCLFADGSVEVLESQELAELMHKYGIADPIKLNQN